MDMQRPLTLPSPLRQGRGLCGLRLGCKIWASR